MHLIIRRSVGLALAGAATACAGGGATTAASPSPAAAAPAALITESSVRRLLEPLAHDSMQGRAVWTEGEKRAARLIAEEMRRIGLEPAGDSGFYQRVPGAVRTFPQARVGPGGDTVRTTVTRTVRLASFADWDSIPAERRRLALNVVGRLPGMVRDSIVMVGAHFDHLGVRAPMGAPRCPAASPTDSIYNGADDDASGVVAMLEIARALEARGTPRRTLVFAAFTGEESGLVGTNWYIQHPHTPMERTVAQLQIEMIGRPDSLAGGPGRAWLTGYERSTMGDMLRANGIPIVPDPRPAQNFFERSDNIAFARAGVPAHTLSSFGLHRDYHCASDETDRTDFAHMTAVIRAATEAVHHLANGAAPQWHPGGRPAAR